jgi:cytochrome c oxidase subunit 3
MQVGTVETFSNQKERRIGRSRISSGSGSGRRGGNGGNNGPNDGPDGDDRFRRIEEDDHRSENDKPKFVVWFLLLVVLMTFGGLIGAYVVVATNHSMEWKPFNLPIQLWVSSALILLGSVTYHFAKIAFDDFDQPLAKKWLTVTTAIGATFISSQILAWLALYQRGLYMAGNPYAGFFYILTVAHAIHVAGGIIALGAILTRSWLPTDNFEENDYRRRLARSVGWYWHFMGGLWIVLFVLLGFWK